MAGMGQEEPFPARRLDGREGETGRWQSMSATAKLRRLQIFPPRLGTAAFDPNRSSILH
jgi:hypothetical protein